MYKTEKEFYENVRSYMVHNLMTEPFDTKTFEAYDKQKSALQVKLQEALEIKIEVRKVN